MGAYREHTYFSQGFGRLISFDKIMFANMIEIRFGKLALMCYFLLMKPGISLFVCYQT